MFKVGIVGLGRIGAMLEEDKLRMKPCTHIGAFKSNGECVVEAVCDVDAHRAEETAEKWKIPNFYSDYKQMMEQHKFDIVSVATPVETHSEIVSYLARHENHPKLIFCEKPLASTVEEGERMVRDCMVNGVKLAVNFTRRWDPIYQHAKKLVDSGQIGSVTHVIGYASKEKDLEGNIHMVDVLNWFSGGQPHLCMYVNCQGEYLIFEVDVLGTEGRIRISDNGRLLEVFKSTPSSHYELISELTLKERLTPQSFNVKATPIMKAVMDLVDSVKLDKEPLCTGQDGLNALRLYERMMNEED